MSTSISSIFSLLISSAGIGFVGLLIQWTIAKQLNVDEFGSFSAAYNMVMLLSPLAGLGIQQVLLRLYGEYGSSASKGKKTYISYILLTTIIANILLFSISFLIYGGDKTGFILRVLSIIIVAQLMLQLLNTKYQIEGNYKSYSILNFTYIASRLIVIYLLVLFGFSFNIVTLSLSYSMLAFFFIVYATVNLYGFENRLKLNSNKNLEPYDSTEINVKNVFSLGWMYGFSGILYLIYYQSDIIIIEYFISSKSAGLYTVSYIIISVAYILPSVVFQKYLLPIVHRWYYEKNENIILIFKVWTPISFLIGFFIAIFIYFISEYLVGYFFGESYLEALSYIYLLVFCIPIKFASTCLGLLFSLEVLIKRKFQIMCFVAALNLVLNVLLIPSYGAVWAAYTTVISEFLILLFFIFIINLRFINEYKKV
ncbi:oligosaccharide flippase family protein [Vibrio parahaemolyticus]